MKKNQTNKNYKLQIGGNIRKWRNLKGIKQKELATSLELSEAAISNIENNLTDITLSQLEDISLGLDVPVEKLFIDPEVNVVLPKNAMKITRKQPEPQPDADLVKAVITSIQKKDEQLHTIMQNVLHTMTSLVGKQVLSTDASRR